MSIQELAARFMRLFAGLDRAYGVYQVSKKQTEGQKVKGRALTEQKPVTAELWELHLDGKQGLGIIPITAEGTVWWSVIDVDVYDLDLTALEKKILEFKLPLVVMRSKSGGAHLFLFCAEAMAAKFVRGKLTEWAILLGYPGVEIFPKQNDVSAESDTGNWLNMPYFNYTATSRYAIYKGDPLTPADFLEFAESRRVTKAALDSFIIGYDEYFNDGPPCLQTLTKQGFPRGTRNKGLFNLGVLARMAGGDAWEEMLDQFNRQYMSPPLSSSEVQSTMKSLKRKAYFYTCSQDPIASVCQKEICRGRKYGIGNNDVAVPPVMIGSITKLLSDPPVYILEVEGVKITCGSDDILQQQRFRKLVFEKANKVVPLLKGQIWDAMLQDKLSTMESLEAPADSGPEGQFLAHLESFCSDRVVANNIDEIILGKPFMDSETGKTIFRSTDLIKYLTQQGFKEFTERKIWSTLREHLGAEHKQYMLKGKCVTAWIIPSFAKQTEAFKVPNIDSGDM